MILYYFIKRETGSAKKKSLSLDEVNFNEQKKAPSNLKATTKKYICEILNKCDNYNREIKALNKFFFIIFLI